MIIVEFRKAVQPQISSRHCVEVKADEITETECGADKHRRERAECCDDDDSSKQAALIEKNVILGGQVGIGEHARIEEGVMLGGQGGVLPNKVLRGKGVAFWGTPARPVREYLKQLAVLARLAKR